MPKYKLMSHQKAAVKFLRKMNGVGALLFDPGVGKTGSTLAYVDWLAKKYGEVRVLVVAPLTAADTWVLQPPLFMDSPVKARMLQGRTVDLLPLIAAARNWTDVPDMKISVNHPGTPKRIVSGNKVTILSMSAGAISTFCKDRPLTAQMLRAIRRYDPHLIVVDESHLIKSATSQISKAMYQIGPIAPHRIILTGTVMPNGPLDVYGQWRFLAPWTFSDMYGDPRTKKPHRLSRTERGKIRPWTWGRFRDRYGVRGGYEGKQIVDFYNLPELHARVAERSMAMTKEEALDLPPVTDVNIHVSLTAKEQRAYDEMVNELAAEMADGTLVEAVNALAKMMKLRQITAGFAKDTETGEVHVIGHSKQNAVKELINTQLVGENRVVVFAYFRSECEAIAKMLSTGPEAKGRKVEIITGSTKPNDRLAIRQRFGDVSGNPEKMVLVAQARTMSLSVNELVTAQHAIFTSLSERRDDWVQARGRLDRNGQDGSKVTFWNVQVPGTIDEIMLERNMNKGNLEKALLDHVRTKAATTRRRRRVA